ncbi:DUF2330 domain-containing protein [Nocardia sp. 2]|uniref:DUF2330 domain-containing protein n=1 Tax=Nocardia acididurans TaxID=2802282 RepID=A0ABS1MA94_9NOCA|nr:DUF2330 domain-containing protein [Nocardia acididurans]MBL1077553.1 DUF2330 domain-containing protein [Nocardia acididurans]
MLLRRTARLLAVVATVAGAGGIGLATPASACACGGMAVPVGQRAAVSDETAVISLDGGRETILMRLSLESSTDSAALIVPTPAPATVTSGTAATFDELREITAPEEVVRYEWFPEIELGSADGAGGMPNASAPGGAPVVLDRVQLGPLEATTLSGGDLTGVRQWLGGNGYVMRDEVLATLQPYLSEGWSFVAMRLTGSTALGGTLDPVRLTFDSPRLVYPMRMSQAAKGTQDIRLYVLHNQRMMRGDQDAGRHDVDTDFAGRVTDPVDADLRALSANGNDYLTELSSRIHDPGAITTDFSFIPSPGGDFRHVVYRTERVEILGLPAGYVLVVTGASVLVVTAAVLLRRRPRAPRVQQR